MEKCKNVRRSYYRRREALNYRERKSLRKAIASVGGVKVPIISEIKLASPSAELLRALRDIESIARDMIEAGAIGLSILTEPEHFSGSLENMLKARIAVEAPIMMKDIVVSME